ncbi:MAG: hypothetical protein ACTHMC_01305 [Pseudobacter sp.]|uniref:hypothetical protein n=1 Tax=Pseudobacter sp. TaxID=2045420 RepID=UPI003F7FBD0D
MKHLKYILAVFLFFSCQKAELIPDPDELQEPREDNVAVVKEGNTWYITIKARFPTEYHRRINVTVFYPGQVEYFVKLPAGFTRVKSPLNSEYGEPLSWEAGQWDMWPQ